MEVVRERHGTAIGVIALDLNDFKMVNDTSVIRSATPCWSTSPTGW